jgi:hypothetical protein
MSVLALISLCIVFGGCLGKGTQKPTEFYLLQPLDPPTGEQEATNDEGIVLGIGPVRTRQYLNRPQIVTRTSTNEITIHDFHYWGEPLDSNFTSILAQNLSILLSGARILIFPYRSKQELPIDYQVVVDVIRFDGEPGVAASLVAQYYLIESEENKRKQVVAKKTNLKESIADDSYQALVSAMSELVADLSREIAEEIKAASQ